MYQNPIHPMFLTAPVTRINPAASWVSQSVALTTNRSIHILKYAPEIDTIIGLGSGNTTSNLIYSTNGGFTWSTGATVPANANYESVDWSPELGRFVAVVRTDGAGPSMYSTNGINWVAGGAISPTIRWRGVAWSAALNKFVAVSDLQGAFTESTQSLNGGVTWSSTASPGQIVRWRSVVWSPEQSIFVAVGSPVSNVNNVATSTNGTTWTLRGTLGGSTCNFNRVIWVPSLQLFVTCQGFGLSAANKFFTSPDGINWTGKAGPPDNSVTGIAYVPDYGFVTVGSNGVIYYSGDLGDTWTLQLSTGLTQAWNDVCYVTSSKTLVAVAGNSAAAILRTYSPFIEE